MTKTKLALLLFCGAFGVNILAFVVSNRAWLIEESKTVWLYELPQSASPLDAGVATDFGPMQSVQATLIRPGSGDHGTEIAGQLAEHWVWDAHNFSFTFHLNPKLTYQEGSVITAEQLVKSTEWVKTRLEPFRNLMQSEHWLAWLDSRYKVISDKTLEITFNPKFVSKNFDPNLLLTTVFTQALTGVIHPANLESLKQGKKVTADWISSGPYLIRKWRPKEVVVVSRSNYALGIDKNFFRVIKYQSAPVINPAAHFLQALTTEKEVSEEHSVQARDSELYIFWICRSWKEASSVCADAVSREALASVLGKSELSGAALAGKTVRYRIPIGSEAFREQIKNKIRDQVAASGGISKEISFFFKNSNDADLELQFVSVPQGAGKGMAEVMSRVSGRLGAGTEPFLNGLIEVRPLNVQWKGSVAEGAYEAYKKIFLEPDLGDKRFQLKTK